MDGSHRQEQPRTSPRREGRSVGRSVRRIDSQDKVLGRSRYDPDVTRDGMLHAAILRSNQTHAVVREIRTDEAEAIPGVECAVGRTELMGLFDERVRHYGDVIAAVAAVDERTARRAVAAIDYRLETLDSVFDAREAVTKRAPRIHENSPDFQQHARHAFDIQNDTFVKNVDDYHALSVGDIASGFDEADVIHEGEYVSPRVSHCNLGSHCTVAEWEGDTLVLNQTIASPSRSQEDIARYLGMELDRVRIQLPPEVTSSFGAKSLHKPSLEPVAATLARETGRPVKLWFDREEEFIATETRHRTYYRLKTGITSAGDITALKLDVMADTGGYPNGVGHIVLSNSLHRPLDLYRIPNYEYEGVSVFTNNIPGGEYRGIGSTQLTFALDSHLDEVARTAGLDPVEFRRRNMVKTGDVRPHTELPIESCGVEECLDRGLETFERIRQGPSDDSKMLRGWGLAAGTHTTAYGGGDADTSDCRLTFRSDGTLVADTAALEHGQGSDTVVAQIIGEETGIPASMVHVNRFATTDELKDALGSVASRTTYTIGAAVHDAASNLATELRERAGIAFDADPDQVALQGGAANLPGGASVSLTDLFEPSDGGRLVVYGEARSEHTPPSYGVHLAEVAVDPATGHVDLLTFVAAQDVGYAINPKMVEGQLEGAICHSTEFALFSELYLEAGVPMNANLADYPAISPLEMPDQLACEIIESNEETGPYGAKGIGTPAMAPVAPAILNALRDATGTRFRAPPVTPETVFEALQGGGAT